MQQYLDLVRHVLHNGERREDRTGTGTLSVFGYQMRFDLREGFPLVTTKKVAFDSVVHELLWMLSGSSVIHDLRAPQLWAPWAGKRGTLGPIYGHQWRSWGSAYLDKNGEYIGSPVTPGIDQVAQVIEQIKANPFSRRHVVSAWNVSDLEDMALPPCHVLFQFYVSKEGRLDCQLYQRSADIAIGLPFNIASYALLLTLVAAECKLTPRYFIHTLGDAHIYLNHVTGLSQQLAREPYWLPEVHLTVTDGLDSIKFEDIELFNYRHHPRIKFEVAV